MKTHAKFFFLLTVLTVTLGLVSPLGAQNKKTKTWEEQKAAKFKPLTAEEKEKVAAAIPEKATAKATKVKPALAPEKAPK